MAPLRCIQLIHYCSHLLYFFAFLHLLYVDKYSMKISNSNNSQQSLTVWTRNYSVLDFTQLCVLAPFAHAFRRLIGCNGHPTAVVSDVRACVRRDHALPVTCCLATFRRGDDVSHSSSATDASAAAYKTQTSPACTRQ